MTHHKPLLWGGLEGQATDIEIHAREVIALKRQIEEIIAQHTGQTAQDGLQRHGARLLPDLKPANQYAIIDQVIANRTGTG